MAYVYVSPYGKVNVELQFAKYKNGQNALELFDIDEGGPYMTASICLVNENIEDDEIIIKDYSENHGVLDFLVENKIVSPMAKLVPAGHAVAHVCKLLKTS